MIKEVLGEYFLNPWAFTYFFAALASLIIGIILIYRAKRTFSIILFTAAQFSNLVAALSAAFATSVQEGHASLWSFWMQINGFFGLLTVIIFLHFSYSHLKKEESIQNKWILGIYIIPLLNSLVRLWYYYPHVVPVEYSAYGLYDIRGIELVSILFIVPYILIVFLLIITALNFVKMYRSDDKDLNQISGYFILAATIPLFAVTILLLVNFISPSFILPFDITNFSTVIVNIIIGFGILKKNLFNINNLLRTKIIPYAITNFLISWVLILTKETFNHIFAAAFFGGIEELSMGLMILLFVPIHDLSHYVTKRLLPEES